MKSFVKFSKLLSRGPINQLAQTLAIEALPISPTPTTLEELELTTNVPARFYKFFEEEKPVVPFRIKEPQIKKLEPFMQETSNSGKGQDKKLSKIEDDFIELMSSKDFIKLLDTSRWNITRMVLSASEKRCFVYWKPINDDETEKLQDLLLSYQSVVQKALYGRSLSFNKWSAPLKYQPKIVFKLDVAWMENENLEEILDNIEMNIREKSKQTLR